MPQTLDFFTAREQLLAQPASWPAWLQFRNLFNYWWARSILTGLSELELVADFGCGSGYGLRILKEQTSFEVQGYDKQPEYLALGSEQFGLQACTSQWDFDEPWLSRVSRKFGAVVCFDMLEQLQHRDVFLSCLTRAMQPSGLFLCSIASQGSVVNLRSAPPWQLFYTRPLIKDLLSRFFRKVLFADEPGYSGYDWYTLHLQQLKTSGPTISRASLLGQNLIYCEGPVTYDP